MSMGAEKAGTFPMHKKGKKWPFKIIFKMTVCLIMQEHYSPWL